MKKKLSRKAIFLDRDGVINKAIIINGKPFSPRAVKDFKLNQGIISTLNQLKKRRFLIIVITNQPDIARGLMTDKELVKMHGLMKEVLPIDDIFICPHDDRHRCSCRKPQAGMLYAAARKWSIDFHQSFMVGDTEKDIQAGRVAGCKTVLLTTRYNKSIDSDYRIDNIKSLVELA